MSRNSLSAYDSAMLSDEGDLYSDDDDGFAGTNSLGEKIIPSAADRRAHHNALERKRRDHIKDSFSSLRDSVPSLQGEKVTANASRAQILKKAAEYIQYMRKKNNNVQSDIDEIAKQNKMLEEQIRRMEKNRHGSGGGASSALSSLYSAGEQANDASTSYDMSENSNGSSASGGLASLANGTNGTGTGSLIVGNTSTVTSTPAATTTAVSIISPVENGGNKNGASGSTFLNGSTVSVRPVTVKANGTTSKIIVQNPQHKNSPHVIHVTTTAGAAAVNGSGNIAAMSSNGTPIIISASQLASAGANGINNGGYVISKGSGAISLANGFRTLVVQSAGNGTAGASSTSGSSAVTTTPNIHILGTIPTANYSKQPTKKLKISADTDSTSNTSNVTSVSS